MLDETSSQVNEINLREYFTVLRRRKIIAVQTFVIVVVVGVVVTIMTKPTFRTSARILVEGRDSLLKTVGSDPLSSLFVPDSGHDIPTQIEVLQSTKVLSEAFNTAGVPPSEVSLKIRDVNDTDVIEITAESTNKDFAYRICNQLPETYRRYMMGNRKQELFKALTESRQSLTDENQHLRQAEENLRQFKNKNRLPDIDADKNNRIAEANNAVQEAYRAQTELKVSQARLAAAKADRSKQPNEVNAHTVVSNNAALQMIQDNLDKLRAERQLALGLYKPGHFRISQLDTQITEEEARLNKTPAEITTTTKVTNPGLAYYDQKVSEAQASVDAAQTLADKAQAHVALTQSNLAGISDTGLQLARLTREVEERTSNVKTLTNTVQMLDLRNTTEHDPLMTITPAAPAVQIAPKSTLNVIYSILVGLVLAQIMALLQEYLDDRVNTPEEARHLLPVPVLGYVPLIEKEERRTLSQARSSAPVLESYRAMRANVRFATVGSEMTSLLITSTAPGEGKSLTATNLAIALAMDGRRVILVDADLRRPTIHEKFGVYQSPGVTNVLVGHRTLEEALRDSGVPNLRLLTSGPVPPNPAELLNSDPMHRLHEDLKEYADVVIYDSPPCLATADALVLAPSVDGVLYVIQIGETRKSAVRHAVELLEQAHANVLGVIFNKMDQASMQSSYYGYYKTYQIARPSIEGADHSNFEFDAMVAQRTAVVEERSLVRTHANEREEENDED